MNKDKNIPTTADIDKTIVIPGNIPPPPAAAAAGDPPHEALSGGCSLSSSAETPKKIE